MLCITLRHLIFYRKNSQINVLRIIGFSFQEILFFVSSFQISFTIVLILDKLMI